LNAHVSDVILQLGCPEVDTVHSAVITLIVSPEGAERIPAAHAFLVSRRVQFLELFVHGRVVDFSLSHVVDNEGHLVKWDIVALLVVAVIEVDLNATVDMLLVVSEV